MLPSEPPLSLHRLVAPVPPARPQETATAAHQAPTPTRSSIAAKPPTTFDRLLLVRQNQVGNAAMAGVAAQTSPAALPQVVVLPVLKPKAVQGSASQ